MQTINKQITVYYLSYAGEKEEKAEEAGECLVLMLVPLLRNLASLANYVITHKVPTLATLQKNNKKNAPGNSVQLQKKKSKIAPE